MPLPPEEENGENAANEEPKLQFSYVECLLFSFHQLGKKLPDFLIDKISAEKLKDFKIRSDLILIIKRTIVILNVENILNFQNICIITRVFIWKSSIEPILVGYVTLRPPVRTVMILQFNSSTPFKKCFACVE